MLPRPLLRRLGTLLLAKPRGWRSRSPPISPRFRCTSPYPSGRGGNLCFVVLETENLEHLQNDVDNVLELTFHLFWTHKDVGVVTVKVRTRVRSGTTRRSSSRNTVPNSATTNGRSLNKNAAYGRKISHSGEYSSWKRKHVFLIPPRGVWMGWNASLP